MIFRKKKITSYEGWPREKAAAELPFKEGDAIDTLIDESGTYNVFGRRFKDRDKADNYFTNCLREIVNHKLGFVEERKALKNIIRNILIIIGVLISPCIGILLGAATGIPGVSHIFGSIGTAVGLAIFKANQKYF